MQMVAPPRCSSRRQLHHRFAVFRVEVTGRFVRQQDRRLAGDGAGHGDALLLTARELRRQVLGAMRHADALERGVGALAALGRLHAAIDQRQLDVLEHGEVANQVEALEDEPDLAVADARALRQREVRDLVAVQHVRAFGRRVQQSEDRQQRRLAAARWAGNGDVFALRDFEVDTGQGVGFYFIRVEHLLDAIEANQGLRGSVHRRLLNQAVRLSGPQAISFQLSQPNAFELIPGRHVGEHDLIALRQAAKDLNRVHRAAAQLDLRAGRFAGGVELEEAHRALFLAERRAPHKQDVIQALEFNRAVDAEVGPRTARQLALERDVHR
jgi:hypothetical protein